jgi:cytochrome c-type biogenesis protein CcmH/NrfG
MKRERVILLAFLILLVYLPFFLRSSSSFLDSSASDVIMEINQANHEDWAKATEEKLRAWLGTHPNDPEVLFSLGLVQKRRGSYSEAEEFYRKAIQLDPKFSEAFSNLGNVYLAKRQTSSAIASYEQAADLNPNQGAYITTFTEPIPRKHFFPEKRIKPFREPDSWPLS